MELLTSKIVRTDGQSLFLEAAKAQGHSESTLVAIFASNSGAMVAGYKSKLLGIDYEPIPSTLGSVPDLTADQIINIDGVPYILQPAKDPITGKANKPMAPVLKFEVGARTMTLGLLQQGQDKTEINFITGNSTRTVKASALTMGDLVSMVGKEWTCKKFWKDTATQIIRNNADGTQQPGRPANCYVIDIAL